MISGKFALTVVPFRLRKPHPFFPASQNRCHKTSPPYDQELCDHPLSSNSHFIARLYLQMKRERYTTPCIPPISSCSLYTPYQIMASMKPLVMLAILAGWCGPLMVFPGVPTSSRPGAIAGCLRYLRLRDGAVFITQTLRSALQGSWRAALPRQPMQRTQTRPLTTITRPAASQTWTMTSCLARQ